MNNNKKLASFLRMAVRRLERGLESARPTKGSGRLRRRASLPSHPSSSITPQPLHRKNDDMGTAVGQKISLQHRSQLAGHVEACSSLAISSPRPALRRLKRLLNRSTPGLALDANLLHACQLGPRLRTGSKNEPPCVNIMMMDFPGQPQIGPSTERAAARALPTCPCSNPRARQCAGSLR